MFKSPLDNLGDRAIFAAGKPCKITCLYTSYGSRSSVILISSSMNITVIIPVSGTKMLLPK